MNDENQKPEDQNGEAREEELIEEVSEQQPEPLKEDIVKSVFDKPKTPQPPSSLFEQTTKPAPPLEEKPFEPAPAVPEPVSIEPPRPEPVRPSLADVKLKTLPLGIDLGLSSVKVAQLAVADDKVYVTKLLLKDFPVEFTENANKRKEELPKFLKDTFQEWGVKGSAYSSVPAENITMKTISLPKMPHHEVESAVNWELKRMSNEETDGVTSDYIILNEDKLDSSEHYDVLTISAPIKAVTHQIELLESAGVKLEALDSESLSLLAGVDYGRMLSRDDVALLIDLGADSTRLNIIRNNELHYSRELNITGHMMTNSIKDYCRVSYEKAEEFKRLYGRAQANRSNMSGAEEYLQIKNAIMLLLEKLVSDIDHTFKYYSYQVTKSTVQSYNKIILSGGTANFQLLGSFLKERVGTDIQIYNPLNLFTVSKEAAERVANFEEDSLRFGVALGLAIRGLEPK